MKKRQKYFKVGAIVISALGLLAGGSYAQQDPSYPEDFSSPMPLFESAMGDFHFKISSDSELAQRYFNQGFQPKTLPKNILHIAGPPFGLP